MDLRLPWATQGIPGQPALQCEALSQNQAKTKKSKGLYEFLDSQIATQGQ